MTNSTIYYTLFILFIGLLTSNTVAAQDISITPLKLNSATSSEIAPFVHDSTIYFISNRKSSVFVNVFNQNNEHLYQLYQSPILPNGKTGRVTPFDAFRNQALTAGSVTISGNGQQMISTLGKNQSLRQARKTSGEVQLGLFLLEKTASGWSLPAEIPLSIGEYSVGQPSLSSDGTMLFFVSNKRGGYGETDIYFARRTNAGWSEPQNLGETVNTPGRELFPFYHPSGKLYFTSNGHAGIGGMDIFYTIRQEEGWSTPVLMNAPINSEFDDFSCFIMNDETSGYFASNRSGIDNIYHFQYEILFCVNPTEVVEDLFCFTFFEESAIDNDSVAVEYRWEFSDGHVGFGESVDHCFPGPGFFEISLNVIDSVTREELYSVANYELMLDLAQQVYFTLPETTKQGESITLQATLSGFGDVSDVQYFWDFGDGERRRGETVHHIFRKRGEYRVKCEAYWDGNQICSYRTIIVN
ncbi:PKD domain-containing protein [Alkaliflexus imshenetskii]|uniref:PKD domain-containing protein n=1 Tax=Alkaliflexus imshenetskii TaxID=286730 RepID=UPI00047E7A36|nr:PKD domain-containing protein [Alkaliflexus imshenetskii]